MKLLALTKYGDRAASVRQRLLQYRPYLAEENVEVEYVPLLDNGYLGKTFSGQRAPGLQILASYFKRIEMLLLKRDFDLLWVQYELFPYFPGIVEYLAFACGRPVVCDLDDAIFHHYDSHANPLIRFLLGRKLEPVLRGSALCICGNAYIEKYAGRLCPHTEIVPTVVDATRYVSRPDLTPSGKRLTIGWIGSPSTWLHVEPYIPLLSRLSSELDLSIRLVGAGPAGLADARFEFLNWSEQSEIADIQGMDIGIMPVPDRPWERGKCGYKLIQYMACGLPVIASPVGVNTQIVEHGVNGFLARDEQEWDDAIRKLAASAELRNRMGHTGRQRVVKEYSLQAHGPRLARLLTEVAYDRRSRLALPARRACAAKN